MSTGLDLDFVMVFDLMESFGFFETSISGSSVTTSNFIRFGRSADADYWVTFKLSETRRSS
jgi:hypothetical protein